MQKGVFWGYMILPVLIINYQEILHVFSIMSHNVEISEQFDSLEYFGQVILTKFRRC